MKKVLITILAIFLLAGCTKVNDGNVIESVEEPKSEIITITDAQDREVSFDKAPTKAVCIGPGALRLYTYIKGSDNLAGVEEIEKSPNPSKPYVIAYPEIMDMDIIGPGGPKNTPDAELLSFAQPDVIFTMYGGSKEELDAFQEKTSARVVALSMGANPVFEEDIYKSLKNIGTIMGNQERADEVVEYMKNIQKDLNERSKDAQSPPVYVGGIGYRGAQGMLSSRAHFSLLQNINANNILDNLTQERNIMLDKEKLLELNPEIIFVDLGGDALIEEDMKIDRGFYEKLQAFQNGTAYAIIPYNSYTTNLDTAMIDMYYMGKIINPEGFEDVNIEQVAEEIYTTLLGTNCYEQMMTIYPKSFKVYEIVR